MPKIECIKFTLPIPPSVNACYMPSGRTIIKSPKYRDWIEECTLIFKRKWEIKGDSWLKVSYLFYMPIYTKAGKKKVKDVFNYEKALSDFISTVVPGFDDHKIRIGTVEKIGSDRNQVDVTIYEIPIRQDQSNL